jgi:hypothetical protein
MGVRLPWSAQKRRPFDDLDQCAWPEGGHAAQMKEVPMRVNEGGLDRAVRVIAGLGILSLAFVGPQTPWGYLGLIPLLTGLVGFCPAYALLGINTCGVRKAD